MDEELTMAGSKREEQKKHMQAKGYFGISGPLGGPPDAESLSIQLVIIPYGPMNELSLTLPPKFLRYGILSTVDDGHPE